MEMIYQSMEQLQEQGFQVSPFCAIDKISKTARPIVYRIIRPSYLEAHNALLEKAKCLMEGAKLIGGHKKAIFGIESKLTEDNQVLIIGQLGSYKTT